MIFHIRLWNPVGGPALSLPKIRYQHLARGLAAGFFLSLALLALSGIFLPSPLFPDSYSRIVLSEDGVLLDAQVASDGQWRFPAGEEYSGRLESAIIAKEDSRFYFHPGVDFPAIARAILQNLSSGTRVSGASTITMQVMRMAHGNSRRSIAQKLREMTGAVILELTRSKRDILDLYLSHAPFGGNIVGVHAASWRYFNRPATELSWAEAATLAVLPNNPGAIHFERGREALIAKRDRLLERLKADGLIDEQTLALSKNEVLPPALYDLPHHTPHIIQNAALASSPVPSGRDIIETTLDEYLQVQGQRMLDQYARHLLDRDIHNAAAVIIDIPSGAVKAYLGNISAQVAGVQAPFVDIASSPRSTGSLLKPLLYARMIDTGVLLPHQLVADIPTRMGGYSPENHTHEYLGAVSAHQALVQSLNVPFARMLRDYGVDRFYTDLRAMGLSGINRSVGSYGITLILGGAESSLIELTGAYASLARSALEILPSGISPSYLEQELYAVPFPVSPGAAYISLKAMQEVVRPGIDSNWDLFSSSFAISWKTGTSYGFRDGWAIGVTGDYAIGVWVGNAYGSGRAAISGSKAAGPLLFDLFNLVENQAGFPVPWGQLQAVEVCSHSGHLAGEYCEDTTTEYVPAGIAYPGTICPYHHLVHLDESGEFEVDASFYPMHQSIPERRFVLPEVMAYYYRRADPTYIGRPPLHPSSPSAGGSRISFLGLSETNKIYIPIDRDGSRQMLALEAVSSDPEDELFWYLNDRFLGTTRNYHSMEIHPERGIHVISITNGHGARASRTIEIISDNG
jgi:penicillin-binding protein 1C